MRYRREGYPEEDEFVLATVTKILGHAVFVNLDEYDKGGLIHISEISPNIRDYVQVGKKVVCKILRVDKSKGHIDLSLRRVNEKEKKKKLEEIKQEQKAEKVIEIAAKELGKKVDEVYDTVTEKAFESYPFVYLLFADVAEGKNDFAKVGFDKKLADILKPIVEERFKPAKAIIKGVFVIKSYAPDGVEQVKKALIEAEKVAKNGLVITILYAGGGQYKAKVEAEDYKKVEAALIKMEESVKKVIKDGEVNFSKE